jgi:hypothetical protein
MSALHELQVDVLDALFERSETACRHVADAALAPLRRLEVYRHSMFESLTAALQAVYPTVEQLVGEGFFRYASHRYIVDHPSRSGNLHDFGGELAQFLERFEPAAGVPYLADVARLEWAWHVVFHADALEPMDAQQVLAQIASTPDAMRARIAFRWQPAAALVGSRYPVLTIWRWHQSAEPGAPIELDGGGEAALVIQDDGDVRIHPLAAAERALLAELSRGATLATAAAAALALDASLDLGAALARHLALGALLDPVMPD